MEETEEDSRRVPREETRGNRFLGRFSVRNIIRHSRQFVVDPEGEPIHLWNALVSSVVIYNLWTIILRISFIEMRKTLPSYTFVVLDFVSDMLCVMDVLIQYRMGYLEDGILVKDADKLAKHYTGTRRHLFFRDVIAVIPLSNAFLILNGFIYRISSLSMQYGEDDVLYPLLRLPKLAKWHSLAQYLTSWDMKTNAPNIHRACKLLLYLATTIHWIGCLYNIISQCEGLGSNEWVLQEPAPGHQYPFFRKYLCSMYWSTMTLTTIGATSSPYTDIEFIFTGCTFLIGVFVFATVVGNVGDVISNMNAARVDFQQKMDGIKLYMRYHSIPDDVQTKVKKWAQYSWNRTHALNNLSTLDILPFRLRAEIAQHVHLETLQKVKIFEGCEEGLLCELVIRLRSQIYSPGDYICRKGEIGREMYIINHGKVEVLISGTVDADSNVVVATLNEGNCFGEISLLKLEDHSCNRRNADVRSVGYSELLVLSKRDLNQALVEYPEARHALEKQARDRIHELEQEGTLRVVNPHLVNNNSNYDRRPELADLQVREREMSELRYIINELKSFDSRNVMKELQGLRTRNQELQQEILTLKKHIKLSRLDGMYNGTKSRKSKPSCWKDVDVAYESGSDSESSGNGFPHAWDTWDETGFWDTRDGSSDPYSFLTSHKRHGGRTRDRSVDLNFRVTKVTKAKASEPFKPPFKTQEVRRRIIHGCLAVVESAATGNGRQSALQTDVIVPGIQINDVSHQEPRMIRVDNSIRDRPGYRVNGSLFRSGTNSVPPLVFVEETELENDASVGEETVAEGELSSPSSPSRETALTLTLPNISNDLLSDVSDIGSDSD